MKARTALAPLLTLLAASFISETHSAVIAEQAHPGEGVQAWLSPVAAPLHSTACQLGGSWCPVHEHHTAGLLFDTRSQHSHWQPINGWTDVAGNSSSTAGSGPSSGSSAPDSVPRQHKPLWPLSGWDVAGFSFAALALLLAASGGIGGGAILVPLNLMVLGFDTSGAVALSNITIVGGTLANLAFNVGRRHPLRPGPLIDWDLIMVMEPSTILGALAGGYLNKLLPGWLTTVTLSILLSFITYKMALKARDIRRRETLALHSALQRFGVPRLSSDGLESGLHTPLLAGEDDAAEAEADAEAGQAKRQLYVAAVGDSFRNDTPEAVQPLAVRPGSASSSGSEDGPSSSGSSLGRAASNAEVSDAPEPGSGHASGGGGGSSTAPSPAEQAQQPPTSAPVPIGPGSAESTRALPMLTPVEEAADTRLQLDADHGRALPPGSPPSPAKPAARPQPWQHPALQGSPGGPCSQSWAGFGGAKPAGKPEPAWKFHMPWAKVAVLLALLAGVVGSDLLKLQVACPSLAYWLRATAMVPITFASLFAIRTYLLAKVQKQQAAGHEALEGDVEWTPRTTLLYPALCTLAGLCAGVFGVGGGIIKGPLMLEMGVLPDVAAATSATMIFFTASAASAVFISFGVMQTDYAVALFALGVVSTAVGQLLVLWVQRHIQSRALLVIIMAVVLGISSAALAVQGGVATAAAAQAHTLWSFHDLCGRAA